MPSNQREFIHENMPFSLDQQQSNQHKMADTSFENVRLKKEEQSIAKLKTYTKTTIITTHTSHLEGSRIEIAFQPVWEILRTDAIDR